MSEPKITGRFFEELQIENRHISPTAGIAYGKLDITGQIQSSDIDFANPIDESKLNLNYPTHPENSTLSLEENFVLTTERINNFPVSSHVANVDGYLSTVPVGNPSTEGVVVAYPYNKVFLLNSFSKKPVIEGAYRIYGKLTNKKVVSQPSNISGVEILFVSAAATDSDLDFVFTSSTLSWNGSAFIDVSSGGLFTLFNSQDDFITVNVDETLLPVSDETDSIVLETSYQIGFFGHTDLGLEFPVEISGDLDFYYPSSKTLHSKSWEAFYKDLELTNLPDVLPHTHTLDEITDVTADVADLNRVIDGTNASVTANALNVLTGGPGISADALHTHSNIIGAPNTQRFIAGPGQQNFDLGVVPTQVTVSIQGVIQDDVFHYSIVGTEVVLDDPTDLGELVIIYYWT